jgi:hypothetical protein
VMIFIIKRVLIKAKLFALKSIREEVLIKYSLKDKLQGIIKCFSLIN